MILSHPNEGKMQTELINEQFSIYKFKLIDFLKELHQFTIDADNSEFQKIVSDLRSNINEPFLFVVVGEVKAGEKQFYKCPSKRRCLQGRCCSVYGCCAKIRIF